MIAKYSNTSSGKPELDAIINKKKTLLFGVLISCILTCLIFAAIEIKYPFFFSTDDNADWYASEYVYVIRVFLSGKFPLYSFTQFCGQRFFANGQSGALNPFMYVAALLSKLIFGDFHVTIEILVLIVMLLGAVGSYILLIRLGACQTAAIAGAVAWNFNSYNTFVGNSWILVIITNGILPFVIYGSIRLCEKPCLKNYLWAIIPKVMLFYIIGHPQFFFYSALYDCLFVDMYKLLDGGKERIKEFIKLVGRYVLVYIAVVILILPLLLPLYQLVGLTKQGQALSFADFSVDSDSPAIGIIWPFFYIDTEVSAIDPFIGYPLMIFGLAGLFLPLTLLTSDKEKVKKYKHLLVGMFATLPGAIIAALTNYSRAFQHLLHKIPLINRFHFLHRNIPFLTSLAIIFSALAYTFFIRYVKDNNKEKVTIPGGVKRFAAIIFVLLESINLAAVFVLQPHFSRGPIYKAEEGYNEEYASMFKDGRYVCVGYGFKEVNSRYVKFDLAHNLRYNLSSYYGLSNVSGYYGVYTNDGVGKDKMFFKKITKFTGDLWIHYPGFIDEMRSQSVNWYILNPATRDWFEPLFEESGLTKIHEDEYGIVYRDTKCEPLAFDEQGQKIELEQGDVNFLKLKTGSDFKGGTITLNYSFDTNFRCFIDGKETVITDDNDNWQMKIECPEGTHDIMIRYIDKTFNICCIISGSFLLLSVVTCCIYKRLWKNANRK